MKPVLQYFRELCTLVPKLRPPKSYYDDYIKGSGRPPPRNVIVFGRRAATIGNGRARANHHRHVLIVALEGEATCCVDATNFWLRPASALLIKPYQYHSFTAPAPGLNWLFITFEAETSTWDFLANTTHQLGERELQLCAEVAGCWQEKQLSTLIAPCLWVLLERIALLPGSYQPEPEPEPDLLVKVNRYALARRNKMIMLDDLARHLGISESHLRSEFRRTTGRPLGQHLRYLRLQHSRFLLHTTDKQVGQIAETCGFDSVYSFSRAFKTVYRISPREYRNLKISGA